MLALPIFILLLALGTLISISIFINTQFELFDILNTSQSVFRYKAPSAVIFLVFLTCLTILISLLNIVSIAFSKKSTELSTRRRNVSLVLSVILTILWIIAFSTFIPETLDNVQITNDILEFGIPGESLGTKRYNRAVELSTTAEDSCKAALGLSIALCLTHFGSSIASLKNGFQQSKTR
jgi:uncharacterized membrane protein YidH (DUF202 family)